MNPPRPPLRQPWLPRLLWLLPVAAAWLVMLPSVSGELVWDDVFWTRQIAYFTSLATVLRPPPDIPDWPAGYFRPVATLSYLLDLRLFGPDSAGGRHLSNLVYHALSTGFVWLLARRLLVREAGREAGALVAALLFAVHPAHTESVCWIGARVDVLATLFLLPTVLLALAWRDRHSWFALLLMPACALLAMGSKEVGAAVLGLVPLALLLVAPATPREGTPSLLQRSPARTWLPVALVLGATAAVYTGLRLAGSESVAGQVSAIGFWNIVRASAYYLAKLLWPWPHSTVVVWEMVPGRTAALAIMLAALALGAGALRDAVRRSEGALVFGLLWIVLAMGPSLIVAVSSFAGYPVAERYLYLPSVGLALAAGALVARFAPARWLHPVNGVAAALIVLLFVATWQRAGDWSSNVRLWSATTRTAPMQGQPWVELGLAHYNEEDFDRALAAFQTAATLRIDPGTLGVAEYHRGVIQLKRQDLDAAEAAFTRARNAYPEYALAAYGIGRVWYERALAPGSVADRQVMVQRSQGAFREAIRLDRGFGEPRLQIVRTLLLQGDLFAASGEGAQALRSYRAGLSQLQTLILAVPGLSSQPGIGELLAELRMRVDAGPAPRQGG